MNGRPLGLAAEVGAAGLHLRGGGRHLVSAGFILSANSWMQHPVSFEINRRGRGVLSSRSDVLSYSANPGHLPRLLTAAFVTAAAAVIGVSAWHLAPAGTWK